MGLITYELIEIVVVVNSLCWYVGYLIGEIHGHFIDKKCS